MTDARIKIATKLKKCTRHKLRNNDKLTEHPQSKTNRPLRYR